MRVLVTRPLDDSLETAARLRELGHDSVIAPLLSIEYRDGDEIALDGVQAILATSANGIRALVRRTPRRDVAVYAVGQQSAEEARAAGFTEVRNAEGGSTALAEATAQWAKAEGGALLHISGTDVAGDLAGALTAKGFTVSRETLYEAVAAEGLPGAAQRAIRSGNVDTVLLFSSRSAQSFVDGIKAAGLKHACGNLIVIAISKAAAEPLADITFKDVRIPARPNQDAMLALLS
ncbi:MAG TPA: uroporphyrinogen-III synthase [Rhizomicrobium sp.]|jgi:uroporphyrinogen-III synthase|nr:uroporphyrinogen-III synthase [Rhizomicrobium sp.]